jgi:hypothetical protein
MDYSPPISKSILQSSMHYVNFIWLIFLPNFLPMKDVANWVFNYIQIQNSKSLLWEIVSTKTSLPSNYVFETTTAQLCYN